MSKKLAIKRLTHSDLSFFDSYFRRFPEGKQKAFNLDRSIVERAFFPSLTEVVDQLPDRRALLTLTFVGPGFKGPHALARKILKQEKNWRLNGELFPNPIDDPKRYDVLEPGDLAVMEFAGTGAPSTVRAALVSRNVEEDQSIYVKLGALTGSNSMRIVSEAELAEAVAAANLDSNHPLQDWIDGDLTEQIGLGSGAASEALAKRRRGRGVTASELARAKEAAERTGRLGEELVNFQLSSLIAEKSLSSIIFSLPATEQPASYLPALSTLAIGPIASVVWQSQLDAVSPYDFSFVDGDGKQRFMDVKSTAGSFGNAVHFSLYELNFAVACGSPYDVFRLFEVREGFAKVKIARNVGPFLKPIHEQLSLFPVGVKPDSFSIDPAFLDFDSTEFSIQMPDE